MNTEANPIQIEMIKLSVTPTYQKTRAYSMIQENETIKVMAKDEVKEDKVKFLLF